MVDNGDFLVDLCQKRKQAVQLLQLAKRLELNGEEDGKIYNAYADAYNAYSDVYNLIEDSYDKLERVKRRAIRKDIISSIFGILGVVGTIFTLISFFS